VLEIKEHHPKPVAARHSKKFRHMFVVIRNLFSKNKGFTYENH